MSAPILTCETPIADAEGVMVGTCQMAPIYGNPHEALREVKRALHWAQAEGIDILCLPECFLTGYFRTHEEAAGNDIDLDSGRFALLLSELEGFAPTLVLGLIERAGSALHNSVAIIESGTLVGRYRKQHLNEPAFEPGNTSPIFEKRGVKFGVNICNDANFPETAMALADRGASVIFYPLNNSLPPLTAEKWRYRHIQNLVARATECSAWVVSSDVVEVSSSKLGYGCTAIVDPTGTIVERCAELQIGRIKSQLVADRQVGVMG